VAEKKRADTLAQNRDILQSKLDLERALKAEQKKLKDLLEGGKASVYLKDRIADLESQIRAHQDKDKEWRTKERVNLKKLDEANNQIETLKRDYST